MGRLPVRLHPAASREVEIAFDWYAERSLRAAERFLNEVDAATKAIGDGPTRWRILPNGGRRMPLRRFPYILFYRLTEDHVEVLAVAHAKRRPGYWYERAD